jgi:Na+-driven multidrug efflux pump
VVLVLAMMYMLNCMGYAQWGLTAVWVCIFLDLLYRGIAMEVVFRRGKWKLQKV